MSAESPLKRYTPDEIHILAEATDTVSDLTPLLEHAQLEQQGYVEPDQRRVWEEVVIHLARRVKTLIAMQPSEPSQPVLPPSHPYKGGASDKFADDIYPLW